MDSINLYVLCKGIKLNNFSDYEKVLTNSYEKKKTKKDEIETLLSLVKELMASSVEISDLDNFFYGFSIPQISKEFDLLKIYENGPIINIELKSQQVELEKIEYQLKKNRYYLAHLNKPICSFTYIKNGDNGQIYSYDENGLRERNINEIIELIKRDDQCVENNIEKLFKAKDYLISPLNTTNLFLQGNYYLTGQQEEIKNKVIKSVISKEQIIWGIQGSAGTGKTLLLYDIAKTLGNQMNVCVIHSGILSPGHKLLNIGLQGVDVIPAKKCNDERISRYDCVLVDEAQRLYQLDFNCLVNAFYTRKVNCIFSYDYYQVLSHAEKNRNIPEQLSKCIGFKENKLSEKIRTNIEVSSFISNVLDLSHRPKRYMNYSNIEILYAEDYEVAREIIWHYVSDKEYTFISYTTSKVNSNDIDQFAGYVNTHHVIGQEFDNVIFSMDNNFRYNENGRLQGRVHPNPDYIFYKLWFQGVSRAREKLCILVIGNEELFDNILKVRMQFE